MTASVKKINEKTQQLVSEYNALQLLIDRLQKQMEIINASMSDVQSALSALDELKKHSEENEILANIGAGVLLKVKYIPGTKIIVPLNPSTYIETTIDEAKNILERKMERLNSAQVEVRKQLSQAASRLSEIEPKLRTILQEETTGRGG
ncbi:MAG: prefoldin subunit alpha [Candidatus Methanomethylicia archaeon]